MRLEYTNALFHPRAGQPLSSQTERRIDAVHTAIHSLHFYIERDSYKFKYLYIYIYSEVHETAFEWVADWYATRESCSDC